MALLVLSAGCITQTQATRELELEHEIALDLQRIEQMQRQEQLMLGHPHGRVDPARRCACSRVPRRPVPTGKVSVHRRPVKKAVLQDQLPKPAAGAAGAAR